MTTEDPRGPSRRALRRRSGDRGLAGGPIYTFDYENRIPYAWDMASWPNGQVPVYTDLGGLGVLTNARADRAGDLRREPVVERPDLQLQEPRSRAISRRSAWATSNGSTIDVRHRDVERGRDRRHLRQRRQHPDELLRAASDRRAGDHEHRLRRARQPGDPRGVDGPQRTGDPRERSERSRLPGRRHARDGARAQPRAQPGERRRVEPATCTTRLSRRMRRALDRRAGLQPGRDHVPDQHPEPGTAASTWGPSTVSTTGPRCRTSTPRPAIPETGGRSAARSWTPREPRSRASTSSRGTSPIPSTISRSYISGQVSKGEAGPDGSFVLNDLTPGARYVIYIDNLLVGRVLGAEAGRAARSRGVLQRRDGKRRLGARRPLRVGDRAGAARRARHGEHHVQPATPARPRS